MFREPLSTAALESFPAQLAVLNTDGTIVYTNWAWRKFGRNNGLQEAGDMVGVDYLSVCDEADDRTATGVARGLRKLLQDGHEQFQYEYPCHGPEQQQWFVLSAHRFEHRGSTYALVVHFDITERRLAERTVAEVTDSLETERKSLEHLLDRIEGLIASITRTVIQSRTRSALERQVCSELTNVPPYRFAWIGQVDATMSELICTATAGPIDVTDDELGLSLDTDSSDESATHVAARAFADRQAYACRDDQLAVQAEDACLRADSNVVSIGAVPIYHGDIPYGVVVVYGTEPDVFTDRELTILETLGDVIATGINAREAQQFVDVDTNVLLEVSIRDERPGLCQLSAEAGGVLEYARTMPRTDTSGQLVITATGTDRESLERALSGEFSGSVLGDQEGGFVVACDLPDPLLEELERCQVHVDSLVAEAGAVRLRVTCPNERLAQQLFDHLESSFETVDLRRYQERHDPGQTRLGFQERLLEKLTPRQRTVLETCFRAGFYEQPRQANGEELAKSMDISRATFHQHRKLAERKLLEEIFDRNLDPPRSRESPELS